jgi:anti-anti-sigma factor
VTEDGLQVELVGAVAVAILDGEVDATRAEALREPLQQAPGPHVVALLLDLSNVSYLDSGGVHLLLDLHRQLGRRGFSLHLVRPQRRTPSLVLDVTDVAEVMQIHPDRETALAVMDPSDD